MNKKEASILIAVLVAFLMMAGHHFVCINRDTVLLPSNIGIAIFFIAMIFGGCLCVLRKYRHINWKNITFLSVCVALILVLKGVLLIPAVIEYLGRTKYIFFNLIYIFLQFVIAGVFFAMAKPKVSKEKTA